MKCVKPQRLGILHRTVEHEGRKLFVPSLLVGFSLEHPEVFLHEIVLWQTMAAGLGEGAHVVFDEAMRKAQPEVLVSGRAFPPDAPQPSCQVRLTFGAPDQPRIDKRLYVFGERAWGPTGPSNPEPFEAMDLGWDRAFGGASFAANPAGRGADEIEREDGTRWHPLPNVEEPADLVKGPRHRPTPAGLAGIPQHYPQRMRLLGTYDAAWRKKRYPGLADDLDWAYFQVAPPDQRLDGDFAAAEPFVLENLHPTRPRIEGRLPEVACRCFVSRTMEGTELEEVPLRADTLQLFPEAGVGVLFFRGALEVEDEEARDVRILMAASEAPGAPRPRSHYQAALAARLDAETGAMASLRDSELMCPRSEVEPLPELERAGDMEAIMAREDLPLANQRRRAEAELARARDELEDAGIDPDEYLPAQLEEPEPAPPVEDLAATWENAMAEAEAQEAQALEELAHLREEARRAAEEAGYDPAELVDAPGTGGPPDFHLETELERMAQELQLYENAGATADWGQLRDPHLLERIRQAEDALVEVYRRFAQEQAPVAAISDDEAAQRRAALQAHLTAGESLDRVDLCRADLSGLDLRGADLRGVYLEAADLTDADLTGANLEQAVLARAGLRRTKLAGANLRRTNLGAAQLEDADLRGADLREAVLSKAQMTRTCLAECAMDDVETLEARFDQVDLSGARAERLIWIDVDLSGSRWCGSSFTECGFVKVRLAGADFSGADLSRTAFATCFADGAGFAMATLTELRVALGSSFAGCDFSGAELTKASLRDTVFSGSRFDEATLVEADLSECDLTDTSFVRAHGPRAQLRRADLRRAKLLGANLMEGSVARANIRAADFRGANLFRVDFARIEGDEATRLDGALKDYIRFVAPEGGMTA